MEPNRQKIDAACDLVSELDRDGIGEVMRHCKTLLALRKSGEVPPDVMEVFLTLREEAKKAGVRVSSFAKNTLDMQRRAAWAIQELLGEHGPDDPVLRMSLVQDMVRHEARVMHEAGMDWTARHLFSRLASPRTAIEEMYPGYITAGLLRSAITRRRP